MHKLLSKDLVRGFPNLNFKVDELCKACTQGKQTRGSLKPEKVVSSSRPIQHLHMDLCVPIRVKSPKGKQYILVIVDDFSRFTWISFLREKSEALYEFSKLSKE